MDGLLGIGQAGGVTTSAKQDEGNLLAARLVEMRKERDSRAKSKVELASVGASAAPRPRNANNAPRKPNRKNRKKRKNRR